VLKMNNYKRFLIAMISLSVLSNGAFAGAPSSTREPIFVKKDGRLVKKIVGSAITTYRYQSDALTEIESADGQKVEFQYDRFGKLEGATLSTGAKHSAVYDGAENLTGFESTSGKVLTFISKSPLGIVAATVTSKKENASPAMPAEIAQQNLGGGAGPRTNADLIRILVAIEKWDTNSDVRPAYCDDDYYFDPSKVPTAGDVTTSTVDCDNSLSFLYIGWGSFSGGLSWGGVLPGGVAPSDGISRAVCMERAYRAWSMMDSGVCAGARQRWTCDEVNMRLYRDEIAYCNSISN
jgi:YD repeat-containing protein